MEYKYLSDGRKVIVIGQLNNNESIVQEIFVTEAGDEIPSGEKFTTKSLHNEPVLSYQQKQIIEAEDRLNEIERNKKSKEKEFNELWGRLKGMRAIVKSTEKFIRLLPELELDTFASFLTGSLEYVVIDSYKVRPPMKLFDEIINIDKPYSCFDSLKLLSVMGRSDGDLEYRINQYSDDSGSNYKAYPFQTYDDAVDFIQETSEQKIEADRLSIEDYQTCVDMGINFKDKHKKLFYKNMKANIKKQQKANQKYRDNEDIKTNKQLTELRELLDFRSF